MEENTKILIKNGRAVDPVTNTDQQMDILIEGPMIVKTGQHIEDDEAQIIDAAGLTVAPGLMDSHVHFRDPGFTYKEDIFTGARAAAAGGVTGVVCMANTKPPVDSLETLDYVQKKSEEALINVYQAATLTKGMKGQELTDMEALSQAGAVCFTDDGKPVMDEKLLFEAMRRAYDLDVPISLHEEDPAFIHGAGVNDGEAARRLGYGGAMRTAEEVMVARDCMLALETGAPVCIQHISSGRSVALVRLAKSLGADVHAEATPHHFTLTEDAVLQYGANARMNPPLRTEEDRQAIIEGICDGTIDIIATDHAPHSAQEKAKPISQAPSGIIGLETSLALGIHSLVEPGYLTLMELLRRMTEGPELFYRMEPQGFRFGNCADFVIFGEKEMHTVTGFASRSSNSPFLGWELPGTIHYTICGGRIVYQK